MKEYKLASWPELSATYHRTVYRRMLSDMSHRYMSVAQLVQSCGGSRVEVRAFVQMLNQNGLLLQREGEPDSFFDSLRPISDWFWRTLSGSAARKN